MLEKFKKKFMESFVHKVFMAGFVFVPCFSAYGASVASASEAATLSDTLDTFSEVFQWFLDSGGDLLAWMLDKPIILLSLAIFFVGAVVGVLARIYSSF